MLISLWGCNDGKPASFPHCCHGHQVDLIMVPHRCFLTLSAPSLLLQLSPSLLCYTPGLLVKPWDCLSIFHSSGWKHNKIIAPTAFQAMFAWRCSHHRRVRLSSPDTHNLLGFPIPAAPSSVLAQWLLGYVHIPACFASSFLDRYWFLANGV